MPEEEEISDEEWQQSVMGILQELPTIPQALRYFEGKLAAIGVVVVASPRDMPISDPAIATDLVRAGGLLEQAAVAVEGVMERILALGEPAPPTGETR